MAETPDLILHRGLFTTLDRANPAAIAAFLRQGFHQHGSLPLLPGTPPQWHGGSVEVLFHMDLA